ANRSGNTVHTVPVVFHIIHNGQGIGDPRNPSNSTIGELLDYLNKTYSACCHVSTSWGSYPNANNGGTVIPIQFALAKRTPECEATNGINRIDGNSIHGYNYFGVNVT